MSPLDDSPAAPADSHALSAGTSPAAVSSVGGSLEAAQRVGCEPRNAALQA
ncbi:MAG: hypothetical protein RLY70_38, partial [Planctomycetota bacterium]